MASLSQITCLESQPRDLSYRQIPRAKETPKWGLLSARERGRKNPLSPSRRDMQKGYSGRHASDDPTAGKTSRTRPRRPRGRPLSLAPRNARATPFEKPVRAKVFPVLTRKKNLGLLFFLTSIFLTPYMQNSFSVFPLSGLCCSGNAIEMIAQASSARGLRLAEHIIQFSTENGGLFSTTTFLAWLFFSFFVPFFSQVWFNRLNSRWMTAFP